MFETTATFAQYNPSVVVFGVAENYKLSAGSGQHNRQQATGNRQQATGNRQQAIMMPVFTLSSTQ